MFGRILLSSQHLFAGFNRRSGPWMGSTCRYRLPKMQLALNLHGIVYKVHAELSSKIPNVTEYAVGGNSVFRLELWEY